MPLDLPTLKSNVRRQNELLATLEDCDHYDGNPEQPLRDDFSYTHRLATLKAVRASAEAELSRLTGGGGNSFAWVKTAAAKAWGAVKASTPSAKTAANWIVGAALTLGVLWGGCLPGPGPNPDPKPDHPTDPLNDAAKFAFQMEFSPTKAQEAADFGKVYRYGATLQSKTLGDFYDSVSAKVVEYKLNGKLPNVQRVVNDELAKHLPNPTVNRELVIDDPSRKLIGLHFGRAAAAWEGLK